ncbi:MAG: hypothetical protein EBS34_00130 [Flavobacteriales bacterium]|nr:hypothetical protein [Flavobacteriales bacterium]
MLSWLLPSHIIPYTEGSLFLLSKWTIKKDPQHLLPSYVNSLPLTGAAVALAFAIINNWTKISLHAGGAGILVGYLVAFQANHIQSSVEPVLISVLLSGLIMSSRYILNKHTLMQLNIGWAVAAVFSFLLNYFYPLFNK